MSSLAAVAVLCIGTSCTEFVSDLEYSTEVACGRALVEIVDQIHVEVERTGRNATLVGRCLYIEDSKESRHV